MMILSRFLTTHTRASLRAAWRLVWLVVAFAAQSQGQHHVFHPKRGMEQSFVDKRVVSVSGTESNGRSAALLLAMIVDSFRSSGQ
jgi:hypothetical protein